MYFSTLPEWLSWIASIHITEIELGLDRVKEVARRLNLLSSSCPVVIVGGTNGKGSTVAGLEAIYRAAHYRVGAFTTPILFKHNEQVRINGKEVSDEEFCKAFEKIESVRENVSLTPFEFHTLAALFIFQQYPLDIMILEVGLGGRLDAVNIIDADVAVVTSISIDHTDWLGTTREDIAREKAGIFRSGKPAVCGDTDPPVSLVEYASELGAPFFCQGKEFSYTETIKNWSWSYQAIHYDALPLNSLLTQNMATVLMVTTLLQDRLPMRLESIETGLSDVRLTGRIQIMNEPVMKIFDVSHNPASVALLAKRLGEIVCYGKTYAVFSMLMDKDMVESIKAIQGIIDNWYVAPLLIKRGSSLNILRETFHQADIQAVSYFPTIKEAYDMAKLSAEPGDRIVVFGSFHTVAEVLKG